MSVHAATGGRRTRVLGTNEVGPVPVRIYDLFMALHVSWLDGTTPDGRGLTLGAGAGLGSPHLYLDLDDRPQVVIDVRDLVPMLVAIADSFAEASPDWKHLPAMDVDAESGEG